MSLKDIYCQDTVIDTLERAMSADRVAHSYIFAGMEGVGKFTTAKELAKTLLCSNRQSDFDGFIDNCGKCQSCKLFDADSHPDFHHIYKELIEFTKDGKGKTAPVFLPIDVIREFFLEKVAARPNFSSKSIYVVSETEKINAAAQNAMLKVLEEPPSHCIIILLCCSMEKLLPTTRSRCQIVRFGSIDEQVIVDKLTRDGTAKQQALFWARFTDGSIGRTICWNGLEAYDMKRELVGKMAGLQLQNVPELSEWIGLQIKDVTAKWVEMDTKQSKSDINRMIQKVFVDIMASVFNDAMKMGVGKVDKLINFDQIEEIKKAVAVNDSEKSAQKIAKCTQTKRMIDSSVNEKLLWEQLLISLAQ